MTIPDKSKISLKKSWAARHAWERMTVERRTLARQLYGGIRFRTSPPPLQVNNDYKAQIEKAVSSSPHQPKINLANQAPSKVFHGYSISPPLKSRLYIRTRCSRLYQAAITVVASIGFQTKLIGARRRELEDGFSKTCDRFVENMPNFIPISPQHTQNHS